MNSLQNSAQAMARAPFLLMSFTRTDSTYFAFSCLNCNWPWLNFNTSPHTAIERHVSAAADLRFHRNENGASSTTDCANSGAQPGRHGMGTLRLEDMPRTCPKRVQPLLVSEKYRESLADRCCLCDNSRRTHWSR